MKGTKRLLALFLGLVLIFGLAACDSVAGGRTGGALDLDYIGEESGEESAAEDNGGDWLTWLKNALMADRSVSNAKANSETQNSKSGDTKTEEGTVQDFYEKGAEEYEANKNNSSSSSSASENGNESGKKEDGGKKDDSSASSSQSQSESESKPSGNTVTITIRCDTAVDNGMHLESKWAGIVPASGTILPVTTVEIEDGETVFSVLSRMCEKYKIHMEYSGGTASGCYVEGINNLFEFDGGRWSGWMYCVNNWYPNYGCGVYYLKAGDVIEWNYTCDLGCDLPNGDPYGYGQDWKDTHD